MKPSFLSALILGALVCSSSLHAQPAHDAHEHGVASLRVVADGVALVIEFVSPLDNLVGFEHAPRTIVQRKALTDAEHRLRDAGSLFLPSVAATCRLKEVTLESPWLQDVPHEHEHESDHESGHVGAHASAERAGHAEMVATYRFECARPEALRTLQTRLFDAFQRLREIRAERATATGQGAVVLRPARSDLPL